MLIIMNLFNVRQLPKLIGKNSRKYKLFVVIGAAALFLYSIPHVYHIFEVTRERALEYNDFVNIIGIIISGMVMIGWAFWEIDEHYKSFRLRMTSFSKTQNSQVHLRKRPRVLTIAIIMMILLTVDVFYSLIQLLLGFVGYEDFIFGFAYAVIIGTAYCVFVYGLFKRIEPVFKITGVFIFILFGWDLVTFFANWPSITLSEIVGYVPYFVLYSVIQ